MPTQQRRASVRSKTAILGAASQLLGFVMVLLIVPRATVHAQQGQSASLAGTVIDASGAALAGVSLTASSPQLIGGARHTETDAEGRYRFTSLLPGVYELAVTHSGFRALVYSDIHLLPGLGPTLDIRMDVAAVAETVNVHTAAPMIDVRSSASLTVIDRQFIDNLPLDRRVVGFVNLAPGVTADNAFGGSMSANPFSLDGTGGNEPGWGSPVAEPNANWLDAIQIVSLGSSAEYGEFTGARVNAITRAGANRFSGLSEYWTTRSSWTGNNRGSLRPDLAQRFRPIEILEQWDTTNQIGGPIVRDRLWFFSGVEYFKYERRPASFSDVSRTPDEPRALTREPKLLVKLTAAPTRSARLEGYIEYDNAKATNTNAGPLVRPEALAFFERPAGMANARFTWPLNDRTLVEARYGDFWRHATSGPTDPSRMSGPPGHFDSFTRVTSVNALQFRDAEEQTRSVAATLTRHLDAFLGRSHTLKVGVEHEWATATYISGWPGGAQYADFNGAPDAFYLWEGATYRPSQRRTASFAQDSWRVNDRLTIEPGVRVGFYDSSLPVEGISFYRNSSVSPRLGAAWDIASDHRTVIRAHYGRYHDPLVTSFYDFLDPLSQTPQIVMQVDGTGQFQELTRFQSTAQYAIDPDAEHSYAEEYFVGVEREVRTRLSVRAQYVRRNFKESLGFIDNGSTWTPVDVTDPGVDGRLGTTDDGGPMTIHYNYDPAAQSLVLTNPDGAFRRYNALQAIATARDLNGVYFQASYTWSRTRGSFNNEFSSNAANNDLSVNGDFVNPNRALYSIGRTTRDFTHDIKALVTYTLSQWGGVRLSAVYRYTSGRPWARVTNFGPLTQLVGIRVEPIGSREFPSINSADVRVEKTFRTGGASTVGLFVNVFNITNQGIPINVNPGSGPNFGLPTAWVDPRRVRAGVRLSF